MEDAAGVRATRHRRRSRRSVVITSSLAAIYANAGTAHYSAAKAGLVVLAKVLAKELAPQNTRVNTIHPTTVATDMILNEPTYRLFRPDLEHPTRADFEEAALTLDEMPVPAIDAVDISDAVLYLVSDDGRYVTGTTHVVDAGGQLRAAPPTTDTRRTTTGVLDGEVALITFGARGRGRAHATTCARTSPRRSPGSPSRPTPGT
ncbi:SDR family oxidoreductase [Geodermatophilus dictyosporus]|uniref:SDR family oxidoreductase n=1 Tax=Geodermatophilus dictyosporus TaxID=1523247 RepID=UPI000A3E8917|nr:SDR family oxidoreductase [Geodermatophilus dictyosporus]